MTQYTDIYDVLSDPAHILWKQVVVAILKAAGDIRNEDPLTPDHARRLAWALSAEINPTLTMTTMRYRILQNAAVRDNPSAQEDGTIQWLIESLLPYFYLQG